MPSITIVTGCPGTGKTTAAARLAAASAHGVHLSGDAFYDSIAHPISPILPASHAQNATVTAAIARAAGAFAIGGYDVVIDGIIGPWFLPTFVEQLRDVEAPLHYVVLRARLAETIERAKGRADRDEPIVRHMHQQFEDLGRLERHALDCGRRTPDETVAELTRRWRAGEFLLDRARIA